MLNLIKYVKRMKKLLFFAILALSIIGCSKQPPQVRDKYCGEYTCCKIIHMKSYRDYNYRREIKQDTIFYSYSEEICIERSKTYESDTTRLDVFVVVPFDTAYAERIRKENEEIRKRNEASICNEDEEYLKVPQPTYHGNRTIDKHIHAYVKGKKLFFDNIKGDRYNFILPEKFDSVYLRNDTLHYNSEQILEYTGTYYDYYDDEYAKYEDVTIWKTKYIAIKKKQD